MCCAPALSPLSFAWALFTSSFPLRDATSSIQMAKQPFPYQPLATPTETRVLQVSPSLDSSAEISAAFETQSLAPAASPEYDALSYM